MAARRDARCRTPALALGLNSPSASTAHSNLDPVEQRFSYLLAMTRSIDLPADYARFIGDIEARVAQARLSASRSVNHELIALYWDIGKAIITAQQRASWGKSIVEQVARDLRASFPGITGFSARNVWDMRRWYEACSQPEFLRQVVAEMPRAGGSRRAVTDKANTGRDQLLRQLVADVPWGHHLLILNKIDRPEQRLYYLRATAAFGWSRDVLLNQVKAGAYERSLAQGKSHNFPAVLPIHLAAQAEGALKSSCSLEFLGINREIREENSRTG
jgi:predicted nuclease of restriction endonuclease-like (RecB) superfamily